jgi:hypothetical protein
MYRDLPGPEPQTILQEQRIQGATRVARKLCALIGIQETEFGHIVEEAKWLARQ